MASKSSEKLIEEIGKMTVLELADFVKDIEKAFGVSAAMPVATASAAGEGQTAVKAEEKTQFKVTLKEVGAEKIKVIKALRKVLPALTLTDAKKAAEETPTVIAESASKAEADAMKKELEEAGAKVEFS